MPDKKITKNISNYLFLNGLEKENKESNVYLTFKFIKNREELKSWLDQEKIKVS